MNEHPNGTPGPVSQPPASVSRRPSLTAAVRARRADQEFFLRIRDAMEQNHRALERLGR